MIPQQSLHGSFLTRLFEPERTARRGKAGHAPVFPGYGVLMGLAPMVLHATALVMRQGALQEVLIAASALCTTGMLVAAWGSSCYTHSCQGIVRVMDGSRAGDRQRIRARLPATRTIGSDT